MREALFHVQFGVVQPSRGDSLHKVAAYNAACKLTGPDGEFNFTRKQSQHVGGCVMAPPHAPPALVADKPALLSAMLSAETRRDGQPARLIEIAIPREIPPEQRLDFVRAVVQPWVDEGAVALVDLHCLPAAADGAEQPHAHVILSRRALGPNGFGKKKLPNEPWTADKGRTMHGAVGARMNGWLAERGGLDVYVDHRSYRDRGDPTPPERNVSRAAWEAHKRRPGSAAAQPAAEAIAARPVRRQLRAARRAAAQSAQEAATLAVRHERQALALRPLGRRPGLPWIDLEPSGPVAAVRRRADAVAIQLRDGAIVTQRSDAIRFRGPVTDAALAVAVDRAIAAGWTTVSLSGADPGQRDRLSAALAARGITVIGEHRRPSRTAVAAAEAYIAASRQPPAAPAQASPSPPSPAAAPPRQASPTPPSPPARPSVPPRPAPRRAPATTMSAPVAPAPVAPAPAYRPPWITSPGRRNR